MESSQLLYAITKTFPARRTSLSVSSLTDIANGLRVLNLPSYDSGPYAVASQYKL